MLKFIFKWMLGPFLEMEMLKDRDKLEVGNRTQKIHWEGTANPGVIKPQLFAVCYLLFSISFLYIVPIQLYENTYS